MVFEFRDYDVVSLRQPRFNSISGNFRWMAILAECDICGAQQRVKDALGGTSVRCKECGVFVEVLKDNVITEEAFFEDNGQLFRREPARTTGVWPWFVAVLVSCLVAFSLVAVVWGTIVLVRLC